MIRVKGRKDYLVALESVAMTDIVLNMFIFFFISFSLLYTFNAVKVSRLEVNLPKAKTAVILKEGEGKIIVTVTRKGEYFIDEEPVAQKDLRAALERKALENRSAGVILKVDSLARFNDVVRALDVINGLSIQKVSIATIKRD